MKTSIWWIRRDFRLADNQALSAALAVGQVIPVFILEPALLSKPALARQGFLFAGLRALDADLRARGSQLIVRLGPAEQALPALVAECGAESVYAEEDYTPFSRGRDERVSKVVDLHLTGGLTVQPPLAVRKADGTPYGVFTPFSRAWRALPFQGGGMPAPEHLPKVPDLPSLPIPAGEPPAGFPAGEAEAQQRLSAFCDSPIFAYADQRNRLDLDGTSTLSPYLRFGMLSARTAAAAAHNAIAASHQAAERASAETWLNELIWREFYQSVLYHNPNVMTEAYKPGMRAIPWRDAPDELLRWQQGLTGYPVVDACMRQLLATGWMHNRGRMIAASFLVKDLLINWQAGEECFMRQLVDGDPAANNGGWQWTAGVGTDAAPYFRIFNPVTQGEKFDPQGAYVRRWVPELRQVPLDYLYQPWLMPVDVQEGCDCKVGRDYPAPIVDHQAARERTLAAYKKI